MTKTADRFLRAACSKPKASPLNATESFGNNAAIERNTHCYLEAATAMSALSAKPSSWCSAWVIQFCLVVIGCKCVDGYSFAQIGLEDPLPHIHLAGKKYRALSKPIR